MADETVSLAEGGVMYLGLVLVLVIMLGIVNLAPRTFVEIIHIPCVKNIYFAVIMGWCSTCHEVDLAEAKCKALEKGLDQPRERRRRRKGAII